MIIRLRQLRPSRSQPTASPLRRLLAIAAFFLGLTVVSLWSTGSAQAAVHTQATARSATQPPGTPPEDVSSNWPSQDSVTAKAVQVVRQIVPLLDKPMVGKVQKDATIAVGVTAVFDPNTGTATLTLHITYHGAGRDKLLRIIADQKPAINKILSRNGMSPLDANNIRESVKPHAEEGMITQLAGSSQLISIGATNGICTDCMKVLARHGVIPATAISIPNGTQFPTLFDPWEKAAVNASNVKAVRKFMIEGKYTDGTARAALIQAMRKSPYSGLDPATVGLINKPAAPVPPVYIGHLQGNPGNLQHRLPNTPASTHRISIPPITGFPANSHLGQYLRTPPKSKPSNILSTQYYVTQHNQTGQTNQTNQNAAQQKKTAVQHKQTDQNVAQQALNGLQKLGSQAANVVSQQITNAQRSVSNFTSSVHTAMSSPSWQNASHAALAGTELLGVAALAALALA